jgi:mannitol/fructose-specific phosphotransferase system IIA component (Ntr-type)
MSHEKDDVTKKEKLTLVAKIARALGFSLKSGEGDEIDLQEDDNAAETLAFKKQLADSETARKKAEDELAAFRKSEAEAVAKAVFARAAADVEALIKEGFMTPAAKDAGVVEAFALLAGLDGKVKFSSAEGKEDEKAPYELMLAAFRSQVPHELKKTFAKNDAAEQPTTDETKCAAFDTARTAFKKEHGREATIAELQEIVGRIVSPEGGQ